MPSTPESDPPVRGSEPAALAGSSVERPQATRRSRTTIDRSSDVSHRDGWRRPRATGSVLDPSGRGARHPLPLWRRRRSTLSCGARPSVSRRLRVDPTLVDEDFDFARISDYLEDQDCLTWVNICDPITTFCKISRLSWCCNRGPGFSMTSLDRSWSAPALWSLAPKRASAFPRCLRRPSPFDRHLGLGRGIGGEKSRRRRGWCLRCERLRAAEGEVSDGAGGEEAVLKRSDPGLGRAPGWRFSGWEIPRHVGNRLARGASSQTGRAGCLPTLPPVAVGLRQQVGEFACRRHWPRPGATTQTHIDAGLGPISSDPRAASSPSGHAVQISRQRVSPA